jgi:hypothetical protein
VGALFFCLLTMAFDPLHVACVHNTFI